MSSIRRAIAITALACGGVVLVYNTNSVAQQKGAAATASQVSDQAANSEPAIPSSAFESLRWRNIGPFRGGRAGATAGVASEPNTFYMGTAGGGVFKTITAGQSWFNVSDGF